MKINIGDTSFNIDKILDVQRFTKLVLNLTLKNYLIRVQASLNTSEGKKLLLLINLSLIGLGLIDIVNNNKVRLFDTFLGANIISITKRTLLVKSKNKC